MKMTHRYMFEPTDTNHLNLYSKNSKYENKRFWLP